MDTVADKQPFTAGKRRRARLAGASTSHSLTDSYREFIASALARLGYGPEQVQVSIRNGGRQVNVTLNGARQFVVTLGRAGVSVSETRESPRRRPAKDGTVDPVGAMVQSLLDAGIRPGAAGPEVLPDSPAA